MNYEFILHMQGNRAMRGRRWRLSTKQEMPCPSSKIVLQDRWLLYGSWFLLFLCTTAHSISCIIAITLKEYSSWSASSWAAPSLNKRWHPNAYCLQIKSSKDDLKKELTCLSYIEIDVTWPKLSLVRWAIAPLPWFDMILHFWKTRWRSNSWAGGPWHVIGDQSKLVRKQKEFERYLWITACHNICQSEQPHWLFFWSKSLLQYSENWSQK